MQINYKITNAILYGTLDCHLCEEAEAMLKQAGIAFQSLDIMDNEDLLAAYQYRIPVLSFYDPQTDQSIQLNWPFTIQDLININDSSMRLL